MANKQTAEKTRKPISKLPTIELVDAWGRLKARLAPFADMEEAMKAELKKRAGNRLAKEKTVLLNGELFDACVMESERNLIDRKAVEQDYGEMGKEVPMVTSAVISVKCQVKSGGK